MTKTIVEELIQELEDIVDWAKVEKAPLRQQEIDSIQAKIAKAKKTIEAGKKLRGPPNLEGWQKVIREDL